MDRIAEAFAQAKHEQRACFVAYICAGDPDFATSVEICRGLLASGVDILEIGTPFSDPLADGLTNQLAAQRALEAGMTTEKVFELVREVRRFSQAPIVFYTYYNLALAPGLTAYTQAARQAGVDGILTLDLPPEEAGEMAAACRAADLKTVFIVAPTTPAARLPIVAAAATGFIYYVSREGVTGARETLADNIAGSVKAIRQATSLPVVVGFGISTGEQARQVADSADGVVVGSALVNCIASNLGQPERILTAIKAKAAELAAGCRRG
jgi:tryptophan synthase alpha chain